MKLFSLSLICVSLALFVAPTQAAIQILKPGAEGKDVQLTNIDPTLNRGNSESLIVSRTLGVRSIGLVEFDLSSIPSGSTINSATLSLFHSLNDSQGSTFPLYQVTSAWDETSVTFNTAPTFNSVAAASLVIPDRTAAVYRDWNVTSLVSGWSNGSISNFGMWIHDISNGFTSAHFSSSDDIESRRPILTIDYTPAAVPEPMSLLVWAGLALVGLTIVKRCKI